jgi:Colicin D
VTTFLDVETDDFLDASRSMTSDVGDPAARAVVALQVALGDCAGMAGTDPGGASWARSYDDAAAAALSAAEEVVNSTYRVGAMFAQSARNYAAADAASAGHPVHVPPVGMFAQTSIGTGRRPPSALGGAGAPPNGWSVVSGVVGVLWPSGEQGLLRRTAAAWSAAASVLGERADRTMLAGIPFGRDRLPEAEDMGTVCESVAAHLRAVAGVFERLSESCNELAHHIDVVHSQVEHELISLAAQTAAIETAGAALSLVTFGAAEAPAQAVEGSRIAAVAARVRALIQAFTDVAGALAARIANAAAVAGEVAARARTLVGARLSAAEVELAARYPRLAQAVRERLAIYRLEGDAGQVVLRKLDVSIAQAERKFKHAADLGLEAPRGRAGFQEFRAALQRFVRAPTTARLDGHYRGEQAILSWSRKDMLVVVQHTDGRFWTCFRPTARQLLSLETRGRIGFE